MDHLASTLRKPALVTTVVTDYPVHYVPKLVTGYQGECGLGTLSHQLGWLVSASSQHFWIFNNIFLGVYYRGIPFLYYLFFNSH